MIKKKLLRVMLCLGAVVLTLFPSTVRAADGAMEIPILMYHNLSEKGPYNRLTLSPSTFLMHMKWLRDNGFTTILPSELPLIAAQKLTLPQRPVVITFDDGYESNYTLAFPVLKQTGMRAGFAVVTSMMGGEHWGMTWDQMREMEGSGLCEFGSHTHCLHDSAGPYAQQGVLRRKGETKEQYLERVVPDLQLSVTRIENELGQPCGWLSYPFGATDPWLDEYLGSSDMFPVTTIIGGKIADLKNGTRNLNRVRVGETEPPWKSKAVLAVFDRKETARGVSVPVCFEGKTQLLSAYNVEGANYVRLRDLALLLSGTKHSFEVCWDQGKRAVSLTTGFSYTVQGGEMRSTEGDVQNAMPRNEAFLLDGQDMLLTTYNFRNTNFVNLRWFSELLDFGVEWDEDCHTVMIQ